MKNFKKLTALALLAVLVGCGGNGESSKPSSKPSTPSVSTPAPSVSTPDQGAEDLEYLKTVAKTLVYSGWSTDGVRGDVSLITSLDEGNVAVTYATNNTEVAAVEEGKLKITLPAEGTTTSGYVVVTVTATLTYNGQTTTKDFLLKVHEVLPETTIADIHESTTAGTYEIKGTVTATNAKGFTVYDGTGHILVYLNKAPEVSVGDYVKVSGTTTFYQEVAQYDGSASVVVLSETAPAEKVFDFTQTPVAYGPSELAAWEAAGAKIGAYVTIKGTLVVDGNYYNVNIKDSSIVGSLSYPAADLGAAAFNGKVIEATGFLLYKSSGKYANLMTTEVKEATLTEAEKAETVKNTLTLPGSVKNTLTLPKEGAYESTISWVSNNTAAITINEDGTVSIARGDADTNVTLTATITVGETTVTKDIVVKVLAIDPYEPVLITAPVAGTAYKFMSVQGKLNNKELYFNGQASGTYLATSNKSADGANVVLVATDGGYHLSIEGETVKYINVRNEYNEEKQKTYTNTYVEDTASTVWTYNTEHNTVVTTIEGTEYYLGTYNEFETFSASKLSYISSSYPARFYTVLERPTVEEPSDKAPIAGKEYKLMLTQGNLNKNLYFAGSMSSFYYATTENASAAATVVLVETEGGFHLTMKDGETTKYLNIVRELGTDGKEHNNVKIDSEAVSVWTYNADLETLTTVLSDGNEYFLGTSGTYNTFSANSVSKASSSFVSHLVDPTATPEVPEVPEPDQPTQSGTLVTAPVADVAYKMALTQGNLNKVLYITGEASGNFLAATNNASAAADVTLVAVSGGYNVKVGSNKYINLEEYTTSSGSKNAYLRLQDAPTAVWVFNTEYNTLTSELNGNTYYMGTYNTFETFSASKISYAAQSTNFISHLYTGAVAETPEPEVPEVPEPELPEATLAATISFADVANRTEFSGERQVWAQNGVTVTNNKASSKNAVADHLNPARFYMSSSLTIEYSEEIVMLVFDCAYADRAFLATDSINGATVTVDASGKVCTIVLDEPATSFTIASLPRQIRANSIQVYTA